MKELKKEFLKRIEPLLRQIKFNGKLKQQSFIEKFVSGLKAIHFAFASYGEKNFVSVSVGIRHDAIEELIKWDNPHLKNLNVLTYTVGADIGKIKRVNQLQWDVTTIELMESQLSDIISNIKQYALPYLEKYQDFLVAGNAFLNEGSEGEPISLFVHERAKRAVAFGYLIHGKEFAKSLFDAKIKYLRENGIHENELNRFISIIEKNILRES